MTEKEGLSSKYFEHETETFFNWKIKISLMSLLSGPFQANKFDFYLIRRDLALETFKINLVI